MDYVYFLSSRRLFRRPTRMVHKIWAPWIRARLSTVPCPHEERHPTCHLRGADRGRAGAGDGGWLLRADRHENGSHMVTTHNKNNKNSGWPCPTHPLSQCGPGGLFDGPSPGGRSTWYHLIRRARARSKGEPSGPKGSLLRAGSSRGSMIHVINPDAPKVLIIKHQ